MTAGRSVELLATCVPHSEDANIPMNADAPLQGPVLPDPRGHALRFI